MAKSDRSAGVCLPVPEDGIRQDYEQLIREIDRCVQDLTAGRLAGRVRCAPGCAECCMAFSVLALEAALLSEALVDLSAPGETPEGCCSFLQDGFCRLYAARPVICRTQGMALAYINEISRSIEVSACPVNFPEDAPLEHEDLFFMDEFNGRLAELNLRYCRQNGLEPEIRIALADLVTCKR